MIKIAPSILSADFSDIKLAISTIKEADWIHCDVMDGHFVPNITFGPKMVKDIRKITSKPLDVHLMINTPEKYLDNFIDAGSDYIVIHAESTSIIDECLIKIKNAGIKCGLAISPDTPVDTFKSFIEKCDLALLMSVYPGFSGQKFIEKSVQRLRSLKEIRDRINPDCLIEMDGGIGEENVALLYENGVDVVVCGNAVFAKETPDAAIVSIKRRSLKIQAL